MTFEEMFVKQPDILDDENRLKNVISDCFPNDRAKINRMMKAYEMNIVEKIMNLDFSAMDKSRIVQQLVDLHDMQQTKAEEAIDDWVELCTTSVILAYRQKVMNITEEAPEVEQISIDKVKLVSLVGKGVRLDDYNIKISKSKYLIDGTVVYDISVTDTNFKIQTIFSFSRENDLLKNGCCEDKIYSVISECIRPITKNCETNNKSVNNTKNNNGSRWFNGIIPVVNQGNNDYHNLKVGATFDYGSFNGKKIKWMVLSRDNVALYVITTENLCVRNFDSRSNEWSNSEIRKWLNDDFYNSAFSTDEKVNILSVNSDKITLLSKV